MGSKAIITRAEFELACRQMGEACSRNKIDIVVGSDNLKTADRFVVEGAAESAAASKMPDHAKPKIWIMRPDYGKTPFDAVDFQGKLRFRYKRFPGAWEGGRVPQILGADAVVLIGGGEGTLSSGHIALALNKPVLAVAYFGGASATLWKVCEPYYRTLGSAIDDFDTLREKWQTGNADLVISSVKLLVSRRTFDPRPRMPMGFFLASLAVSLTAWVYLFARASQHVPPLIYSYFLMLALAGVLGSILRTSMRLIRDDTARFSWNQLLLELAAGLLLGFGLALLFLIGSVTINGNADPLTKGDDGFRRVAVVMTLLGLGGAFALEQASDRVSQWFDEQLKAAPSKRSDL